MIAATHRDIAALVREGQFREDLYYRLNVIPVQMPPLRDRRSDIAALVSHFIDQGQAAGLPARAFTPQAIGLLESHSWPGNIRELANVVQRLTLLARDTGVTADDVRAIFGAGADDLNPHQAGPADAVASAVVHWTTLILADRDRCADLSAQLADVTDRALLGAVMEHCHGNQLAAARILGINRNTLRKRLGELGLHAARKSS